MHRQFGYQFRYQSGYQRELMPELMVKRAELQLVFLRHFS